MSKKDKSLKKFISYVKRWHEIKKEFDFKEPTKLSKEIWTFKRELKQELSDPRFLKIAESYYAKYPVDFIEH